MQKNETQNLGIGLNQNLSSYRSIQIGLIAINKLSSDTSHSYFLHDLKQTEMMERSKPEKEIGQTKNCDEVCCALNFKKYLHNFYKN